MFLGLKREGLEKRERENGELSVCCFLLVK